MDVAVVIANPRSGGRTTAVAEAVAAQVTDSVPGPHSTTTYELSELTGELFDWQSERVAAVNAERRPGRAGRRAGDAGRRPQASPGRRDAASPGLVELAAILPTRGLFVVDSELDKLDETIAAWWATAGVGRILG